MPTRPLILISNDDGFRAAGLIELQQALAAVADVVVCAPYSEQSGTSHSISLTTPLRLRQHGPQVFSVDGTPADSVYVALCAHGRVLPGRPDVVVSGINHGLNLAGDVFYSGTVAAAREAALRGFRALALSAGPGADLRSAAACAVRLVQGLLSEPLPKGGLGVLLNVNFPAGERWPLRATRLGLRRYEDVAEFRRDPRGGEYLWLGGSTAIHGEAEGSDTEAYDAGVVGVTPLSLEMWDMARAPLAERIASGAAAMLPVAHDSAHD
ncbi:MAG TPA: 5'/3'-nucleotidase SurE [Polyangiaceae bacterium]|nr:5'/3'-nucleotidase SurE [Polyangiaceae bacterium]